jgi:hypothetical protein
MKYMQKYYAAQVQSSAEVIAAFQGDRVPAARS